MNLCSENHDEICFEGRKCPLCEMKDELENEIQDLKEKLEDNK
ncbi:MAG: hypothetical protein WCY05_05230 [Candidatus Omnitrophota bacterium]